MHCLQAWACMQNFKKIYQAEVPQILIPKFLLDRDDEYRCSELRKTYKKTYKKIDTLNINIKKWEKGII